MATYAIGDLQGCYSALQRLLDKIQFDPGTDTLWFAGDLVSRGTESLQCLRFVKSLGDHAITVLGNHDLSLLAAYHGVRKPHKSLKKLINAPDYDELMFWLRRQPLLHLSETHQAVMTHAGIPPTWDIETAKQCAQEVEQQLRQYNPSQWFEHLYGDEPNQWSTELVGIEKQRYTINALTRMRYCYADSSLEFQEKLSPDMVQQSHPDLVPWFKHPHRHVIPYTLIFGHWSTLGYYHHDGVIALDTGCVWNGALSAVCLETKQHFQIACHE